MKDNTNNKQFWNNYVTYWENKVKEANNDEFAKDKTSNDEIIEKYFSLLESNINDVVLDFGCGSGRLFPIYQNILGEKASNYVGIDISGVALEHAVSTYKGLEIGKNLFEFDGLNIPFEDNCFNKIVCFGVFDACKQEVIIRELLRVLKEEGLLLITGKNNRYFEDDEEALIAEINARKKEHPNSFTDVADLIRQLKEHGVEIVDKYYFLRRGDFPKNKFVTDMPTMFYEWVLILKKTSRYQEKEFFKFSDAYSKTFGNISC